jgi:SAM-dependent methyltransferase
MGTLKMGGLILDNLLKKVRQAVRKIIYPPAVGTRYVNLRNTIMSQICAYYYRIPQVQYNNPPVVADLGGIGKDRVMYLPGWGTARVLTINLFDDADINDDARKLEKVEDNSLDGIYTSHLIEHLWWWELTDILRVWHKKLKPNGRIEIRCPDIEWIIKKTFEAYKRGNNSKVWEDILFHTIYGPGVVPWHRYFKNEGQYHRNTLWERRLKEKLTETGFHKVRRIYCFRNGLDHWPYDITYKEFYGKILIRDLVMEGYKS